MTRSLVDIQALVWERAVEFGPRLLLAVLLLLAGLLAARAAARSARWMLERVGLDALLEQLGTARPLYALGIRRPPSALAASLVAAAVLLATLALAAEVAGLPGVAQAIGVLLAWLPRAAAAAGIAVGGAIAADYLQRAAMNAGSRSPDLVAPDLVSRLVYFAVLLVSLTVAAQHLGLDMELVADLVLVIAGAGLAAAGLAFALGARPVFRNIIARPYAERLLSEGDRVEVDGVKGIVVGFRPTALVLRFQDDPEGAGSALVPYTRVVDGTVRSWALPDGAEE